MGLRAMNFGVRGIVEQLDKRIEEQTRATNRALDAITETIKTHGVESRNGIRDLSEQVRGQFDAVQTRIEERHKENRNRMWTVGTALAVVILGAIATSYFTVHGFTTPASDATIVKSLSHIESTLQDLQRKRDPGFGG